MGFMNSRKFLCIVIYFSTVLSVFSQVELGGRVVDQISGNQLKDVQIRIENESEIQFSDQGGYFKMKTFLKNEVVLICELKNYENLRTIVKLPVNEKRVDIGVIELISVRNNDSKGAWVELSQEAIDSGDYEIENISGLLSSGKDVFSRTAAFDFGSNFFRRRFLGSEHGVVMLNGVGLNKVTTGRPEWSNWGGLNDALRKQEIFAEMTPTSYELGGMAKSINMMSIAGAQKKGIKLSISAANKNYKSRLMLTYASGLLKKRWSFMLSASLRKADEGFRQGTKYVASSFLVSIDKQFGERHQLNSTIIYADNFRGKSSALTQEVFELKDNSYNSYWGYQIGKKRNSREKRILEPIFQLNYYFKVNPKLRISSHLTYQYGQIAQSRLDYGGSSLVENHNTIVGRGSNPDPSYYQKLPSYFLRFPANPDYAKAYLAEREFKYNGQIDWAGLYEANLNQPEGKNAIYALYEDKQDSENLSFKTTYSFDLRSDLLIEGSFFVRRFKSENYAYMTDLLGGEGYLDIDSFADNLEQAQKDLQHPNRIVGEKEKFRYCYELYGSTLNTFLKTSYASKKSNIYFGVEFSLTNFQRDGIYENGANPGSASLGKSRSADFVSKGFKTGYSYRISGRHILTLNGNYLEEAPAIRYVFSNVRESNELVKNLVNNVSYGLDLNYTWRHPVIYVSLSGYFLKLIDATNISFYYADGLMGLQNQENSAYVQEILTGIDKQNAGIELAIEVKLLSDFKIRGVAALGSSIYVSNPELYLTSNSIDQSLDLGASFLKGYYTSGGAQSAFSLGFEYSSPNYWWLSSSLNVFDKSFISIAPITRTKNYFLDADGLPINGIDPEIAKDLLKQESLDPYMTINIVGGKSWKIKNWYVGFFASINNLVNSVYKTGGFEQSRNANYQSLLEERHRENPLFGPKYWFSYGTTFFTSFYVRI